MYYTCFTCPEEHKDPRELADRCPSCGKAFGFPLDNPPASIGSFGVLKSVDRGFYGATYVVQLPLGRNGIAKVVPKAVYNHFEKGSFEEECRRHAELAEGTAHVVKILDSFDADLSFGDVGPIECHVAVMDMVKGPTLQQLLDGEQTVEMPTVAQIAVDLCAILAEFEAKGQHHNDLHARNLIVETLPSSSYRANAIDPRVRVVAIDLGSISSSSKSNPAKNRLGDRREVAVHLRALMDVLVRDPERLSDPDFRLARAIDMVVAFLTPDERNARRPEFNELMNSIYQVVYRVSAPWTEPLMIQKMDHFLNAQLIEPWFVPFLFVDPKNTWFNEVSDAAPTLITGMRGCGKTMLLRSLDIHARLRPRLGEFPEDGFDRVKSDGFIGLYFPSTPLLDARGQPGQVVEHPDARLFVGMASKALSAVRHLRDVAPESVRPEFFRVLGGVVSSYVSGADDATLASSDFDLERTLVRLESALGTSDPSVTLKSGTVPAFNALAQAVRECSAEWGTHRVFYLLDDVSTRYLSEQRVRDLLPSLIFPSEVCAFKMTTEEQTLQQVVPTSEHTIGNAREGRDYRIFNLGREVYSGLTRSGFGERFMEEILRMRAQYHPMHPAANPSEIIGAPESIDFVGRRAIRASVDMTARRTLYHGMTALARVSAGDIGESIRIYDRMLARIDSPSLTVLPKAQTEIYLMHCGENLVRLERERRDLKEIASGFAAAARQALIDSELESLGPRKRLREYSRVLLQLSPEKADQQRRLINELVDARIFVLQSPRKSRTKSAHDRSFLQIALVYRKLYGLDQFIGLGHSDRFELSPALVEEWLENPLRTKEILLSSVGTEQNFSDFTGELDAVDFDSDQIELVTPKPGKPQQFLYSERDLSPTQLRLEIPSRVPRISESDSVELESAKTLVCGLGFEDRTLESVRRALSQTRPERGVLIRYPSAGHGPQIEAYVRSKISDVQVVEYSDFVADAAGVLGSDPATIDITGLAKPAIFHAVRGALLSAGSVNVAYTQAEAYSPPEREVANILNSTDPHAVADRMARLDKLMRGERGGYVLEPVFISGSADESRRRVLSAIASPKYLRLFHLLDERAFDHLELIVQTPSSSLGEMARYAAVLAESKVPSSNITEVASTRIDELLEVIDEQMALHYDQLGSNVEFGLTGSKVHTAACATASTVMKPSAVWYVRPDEFNEREYSFGTADSHYLTIRSATGGSPA